MLRPGSARRKDWAAIAERTATGLQSNGTTTAYVAAL